MDARALLIHANDPLLRAHGSALSLKGWRVQIRHSRAAATALLAQEPTDVVIIYTGGSILAADIIWMLEELNALTLPMPMIAVTDQHHLFDEHKLLRRAVVLAQPRSAQSLAEAISRWYLQYRPKIATLADILYSAHQLQLTARLNLEVEGQRLGVLKLRHGELLSAHAPGLRGVRALQFLERLEQADLYQSPFIDAEDHLSDPGVARWLPLLSVAPSQEPQIVMALTQMLQQGIARQGVFGLLDKTSLASVESFSGPQSTPYSTGLHEDTSPGHEISSASAISYASSASSASIADEDTPLPFSASKPTVPVKRLSLLQKSSAQEEQTKADGNKTPRQPAPAIEDPYERLYKEATLAYIRRDYEKALTLFKQCAQDRPDDKRVTHNLEQLHKRYSSKP